MLSYNRLINEHPNSSYISQTLVQIGLLYISAGNIEMALDYYTKVVDEYPGTAEASNALKSIREIYIDLNRVDEFLAFLEKTGQLITVTEQDSLMYFAAENVYLAGDCDNALPGLENYIARFPSGGFPGTPSRAAGCDST